MQFQCAGDVGPPTCETNDDCKGALVLAQCEGAVCVAATGDCVAIALPAGSKCAPLDVPDPACYDGACNDAGQCEGAPLSDTTCDDGDACTLGDACQGGSCSGAAKDCSDDNPCTSDQCDPATGGCTSAPVETDAPVPCDDGNPCTPEDLCEAGECVPGENVCECQADADCPDDGDACNGPESCIDSGCVSGPAVECDTSAEGPCHETACVSGTGECVTEVQAGATCDDDDPCTYGDQCTADGGCAGTEQDCDDAKVCTDDACVGGQCENTANAGACNDGNPCTAGDVCSGGVCKGAPVSCDDSNPCTADACNDLGECVSEPTPGDGCDDGDACTDGDTCSEAGDCAGAGIECDDDNPCTDDGCDSATGCVNASNDLPCSDGDACTVNDTCAAGGCQGGAPIQCADPGECKTASCDPKEGCLTELDAGGSACDDGDKCTAGETCLAGKCQGGEPACECLSDGDCDDGDACNGVEACVDNSCTNPADVACADTGNPCTVSECDPADGQCQPVNANEGKSCGVDDACVVKKLCAEGSCQGTPLECVAKTCFDATGCDPDAGCSYAPSGQGTGCDDGDKCTALDTCDGAGTCAGQKVACDDENGCTKDGCKASEGCVFEPIGGACDLDDDACTEDQCAAGKCAAGALKPCDDGVACTKDVCDPVTGQCSFTPDDGSCDDDNGCTTDTCTDTGCDNEAVGDFAVCDDGDGAFDPDLCFGGQCLGGAVTSTTPSGFCSKKVARLVGATFNGSTPYVVGTHDNEDGSIFSGCKGTYTPKSSVYKISADKLSIVGSATTGTARDIAGTVIVGEGSLVGEVSSDTVKWNSGTIHSALKGSGSFDQVDLHAVATAKTTAGVSSTTWYLVGGYQDTGDIIFGPYLRRCTSSSCSTPSVSGTNKYGQYRALTLSSKAKSCSNPPCIYASELGSSWLAMSDGNFFYDSSGANSYLDKVTVSKKTIEGAVIESQTSHWIYGQDYLVRCQSELAFVGEQCVNHASVLGSSLTLRGAFAYAGGVLFVHSKGGGIRLYFLPAGKSPTSKANWTIIPPSGSNAFSTTGEIYAVAGSTSKGIYMVGSTQSSGTKFRHWSFLP